MQQVISHGVQDIIEKFGDILFRLSFHTIEDSLEEFHVISAACLEDLFLGRCTLEDSAMQAEREGETYVFFSHSQESTRVFSLPVIL